MCQIHISDQTSKEMSVMQKRSAEEFKFKANVKVGRIAKKQF